MWDLDYKESWALKNWCFWTVVLEKLLRVPKTARRSNQSILKEINSEYTLERLMLILKLRLFVYMMWKVNSLDKTLMLGKFEDRRRRGWQRMRWLDGVTNLWTWFWASWRMREAWGAVVHGVAKSQTWLSEWTTTKSWTQFSKNHKNGTKSFLMIWFFSLL